MHASYTFLAVALLPLCLAAPAAAPNPDVIVTVVKTITKINGVEVEPKTYGNTNHKSTRTRIHTTTIQPAAPVVKASKTAVVVPASPASSSVAPVVEPVATTAPATIDVKASTYTDEAIFKRDMLAGQNWYRDQHGAIPLVWNDTIAAYAQNWANACNFKHSGGPTGENLAAGASTPLVTSDMWGQERTTYNWGSPTYSHFTAMVWKATTSVGCARKQCNGANGTPGFMVVCEYYPAGNMLGAGGVRSILIRMLGRLLRGS
ncbi:CAP domain-containing protein [Halenospora varia]|nr:CAP domain-containing protein [Halenospora varia]